MVVSVGVIVSVCVFGVCGVGVSVDRCLGVDVLRTVYIALNSLTY